MTTCCERHDINCDQGRLCPERALPLYEVRVARPGVPMVEYTTRAPSTYDAISDALTNYGISSRVSAKVAAK